MFRVKLYKNVISSIGIWNVLSALVWSCLFSYLCNAQGKNISICRTLNFWIYYWHLFFLRFGTIKHYILSYVRVQYTPIAPTCSKAFEFMEVFRVLSKSPENLLSDRVWLSKLVIHVLATLWFCILYCTRPCIFAA